MKVTHKVVDNNGITLGFMISNKFYNDYTVKKNLENIDNVRLLENGALKFTEDLPELSYQKEFIDKTYNKLCKQNTLKRDIQADFEKWRKNYSKYVLQVSGPRQVGKTAELLRFAYKNYSYIIYLDIFDEYTSKILYNFINGDCSLLDMSMLCLKLNLPRYVDDGNTILIIDEVQRDYHVYNSVRKIHDNFKCDIVIIGTILENKNFFLPVDTLVSINMLPLKFGEFCKALNNSNLNELYKIYLKIGGHPDVVSKYIETKDIEECNTLISWILNEFGAVGGFDEAMSVMLYQYE